MSKTLVAVDVDLTLMVWDYNGDYNPSSVMTFQYFIAVSDFFMTNLQENTKSLMDGIYKEHYQIFREREPNDLNYIAVVSVSPKVVAPEEYPNQPWLKGECPAWESSNCVDVKEPHYFKMPPNEFARILV